MTPTPKQLTPSLIASESPTLEALTSPRPNLTETLLGIDPSEAATAGSIYRQDDDPFGEVEVEEDGDTGDGWRDEDSVAFFREMREWIDED